MTRPLPPDGAIVTVWDDEMEMYRRGRVLRTEPESERVSVRFDDGETVDDIPSSYVHEGEPEEVLEDGQPRFALPDEGADEDDDKFRLELDEVSIESEEPDDVEKLLIESEELDGQLTWDDEDD